jgi:hypothetical protein
LIFLPHSLPYRLQKTHMGISGVKPDHRHCLLLPAPHDRPRGRRAADQRDELPSP